MLLGHRKAQGIVRRFLGVALGEEIRLLLAEERGLILAEEKLWPLAQACSEVYPRDRGCWATATQARYKEPMIYAARKVQKNQKNWNEP